MATLTFEVSDALQAAVKLRAAEAGFTDLSQFVIQLIVDEASGAPEQLSFDSEQQLQALLVSRTSGPFVEMDKADFQQMRDKLKTRLQTHGNQS